MAKKGKNTLKDLNEFMKNQPKGEEGSSDFMEKKPTTLVEIEGVEKQLKELQALPEDALKEDALANFILQIANAHNISARKVLYKICEAVIDKTGKQESTDIMLMNTILYLSHHESIVEKLR